MNTIQTSSVGWIVYATRYSPPGSEKATARTSLRLPVFASPTNGSVAKAANPARMRAAYGLSRFRSRLPGPVSSTR